MQWLPAERPWKVVKGIWSSCNYTVCVDSLRSNFRKQLSRDKDFQGSCLSGYFSCHTVEMRPQPSRVAGGCWLDKVISKPFQRTRKCALELTPELVVGLWFSTSEAQHSWPGAHACAGSNWWAWLGASCHCSSLSALAQLLALGRSPFTGSEPVQQNGLHLKSSTEVERMFCSCTTEGSSSQIRRETWQSWKLILCILVQWLGSQSTLPDVNKPLC